MAKKEYPGGFRLTLATARRLAVQEFGTVSAPVIKCKKTPRKTCSFVAEVKGKR